MIDQLMEDHDQIRDTAATLRAFLIEDGMPIGRWFATARWTLTRHLLRHLATEEVVLRGHGGAAQTASATVARGSFAQHYRQHVCHWTPERIDREWPRYRQELGAILNTLDRRMTFEEREIYPKLSRPGAIAATA